MKPEHRERNNKSPVSSILDSHSGCVVGVRRPCIDVGRADLPGGHAISKDIAEGPRIVAAGRAIAVTGGHADPSNGMRRDLQGDPGPDKGVINGPDDARKALRQRYKEEADVIKNYSRLN